MLTFVNQHCNELPKKKQLFLKEHFDPLPWIDSRNTDVPSD